MDISMLINISGYCEYTIKRLIFGIFQVLPGKGPHLHHWAQMWAGLGAVPDQCFGKKKIARGWWFQPLWKIVVCWDHYSQYMEKNKQNPNHQPDSSSLLNKNNKNMYYTLSYIIF